MASKDEKLPLPDEHRYVTLLRHRGCPSLHLKLGDVRRCAGGWVHLSDVDELVYELLGRQEYRWDEEVKTDVPG